MSNLARTLHPSYSLTSLKCVQRKVHAITKRFSQIDLANSFAHLKDGIKLIPTMVSRSVSSFYMHPEKIKQAMKARDGQMLCNFFDSENYKKSVFKLLEEQRRIITQDAPLVGPSDVKYQHILSCAQPSHKRKVVEDSEKDEEKIVVVLEERKIKKKKPRRTTIMNVMLRKKSATETKEEIDLPELKSTGLPLFLETKQKTQKKINKKYRKKTTILPLFLKKIQENRAKRQTQSQKIFNSLLDESAKEFETVSQKSEATKAEEIKFFDTHINEIGENESFIGESKPKGKTVVRSLATLALVPKFRNLENLGDKQRLSNQNREVKYEAELPEKEDIKDTKENDFGKAFLNHKTNSQKTITETTKPDMDQVDIDIPISGIVTHNPKVNKLRFPWMASKKLRSKFKMRNQDLFNKVSELDIPSEKYNTSNTEEPVVKSYETKVENPIEKLSTSNLFEKVKLGSLIKPPHAVLVKGGTILTEDKQQRLTPEPSLTYKLVSKGNKKRENAMKVRYNMTPICGDPSALFFKIKGNSSQNNEEATMSKHGISSFAKNLVKPPTPFVDFANKDESLLLEHLIRLPKTTSEGYRVLLYSVRDPDPTKLNFSDAIKGFCMYNDCILSEDGLQEGYVVIFDMKGVQLGHLARVSLPALRCFMTYIQEAHPCRLKAIHVLNTASWIHHIMRIIVPMVKSDLLNLVSFHRGHVPEGFPLEILPMNYGGEAPSIDDLDKDAKQMVHKYQPWLVESGLFMSDESKRVKKTSWWGFLSGNNKSNNVELDEKTILKNLQID